MCVCVHVRACVWYQRWGQLIVWAEGEGSRQREENAPGTRKLCIHRRRLEFRGHILLFLNSAFASEDILLWRRSCSFSRHFRHFYFIYYLLPSYFSSWFIFRSAPSFIRIPSRRTRFRLISLILWALICIYIIFYEVSRCCSSTAQQPVSQLWSGL